MNQYYTVEQFCDDVEERYDDYSHIARTVALGLDYLIEHNYDVYDFVDLIISLDKQHDTCRLIEDFRRNPRGYGMRHLTFEEIADNDIPF